MIENGFFTLLFFKKYGFCFTRAEITVVGFCTKSDKPIDIQPVKVKICFMIAITLVFTDEAICIRPESLEMTKLDEANKYVASSTVVLLISETILNDLLDISLMWEFILSHLPKKYILYFISFNLLASSHHFLIGHLFASPYSASGQRKTFLSFF